MHGENLAKHFLHFLFWYSEGQKSRSMELASFPGSFGYRINFSFSHCLPLASQFFEQKPSLTLLSFPMSLIWQIPRTTSPISSLASLWESNGWFIHVFKPEVLPLCSQMINSIKFSTEKSFLFCKTKNRPFFHWIYFAPIYNLDAICQQDVQN